MFSFISEKSGYTSMNIDSEQIKLKALGREGFIFNMTFLKPFSVIFVAPKLSIKIANCTSVTVTLGLYSYFLDLSSSRALRRSN